MILLLTFVALFLQTGSATQAVAPSGPASAQSAPTPTTTPRPADQAPPKKPLKKRHKTKAKTVATPETPKVVVRNGGTSDPGVQLTPSVPEDQASKEKQNTTQMLAATDSNLQKLSGRQLNPAQQDMLTQIRSYMDQAKTAVNAGDLKSAHTLALKAQLLSNDLLAH